MKAMLRIITFMLMIVLITVPCVSAAWRYSSIGPSPVYTEVPLGMTEFKEEYKGVYIKSVEVINTTNAVNINNGFTLPTTHNSTVDPTATGGFVTYKIVAHNNTELTYWYIGEYYDDSNQNSLIGANGGINVITKDQSTDSSETFNSEDWIPPQTERTFYVTYVFSSNAQSVATLSVDFRFNIRMDAVHDEFLAVLNNVKEEESYEYLASVFNEQYSKDGALSISTESHPEVFERLFPDLDVSFGEEEKRASVIIRRQNLDNDTSSGDSYSGGGPVGCEYTLYITVEPLTPGTRPIVYAISYSEGASGMGEDWYQIGELYEGTAPVKADGTIDYENWKATSKTYEIADGIYYKVAAPNGDQYDIMNTMEQLISAVDQDIFNDIDNKNIFKKVYDIIKKYPQDSTDPAVVGLRTAFEDASIFYRNLNNGQEFKVVRDKYTRAEIIFALKNIQKALDYYYQTGHT